MARLTLRGETRSVEQALTRLDRLINTAEASTRRLLGISSTLAGHYQAAGGAVQAVNRLITRTSRDTTQAAGAAKTLTSEFQATTGALQRANTQATKLRNTTIQTARAARTTASATSRIRFPSGGTRGASSAGGSPVAAGSERETASAGSRLGRVFRRTFSLQIGGNALTAPITRSLEGAFLGAAAGLPGIIVGAIGGALRGVGELAFSVLSTGFRAAIRVLRVGLTAAIAAAAVAGGVALQQSIQEEALSEGFRNLVDSRALGEQTEVLERLRVAARGTVSDVSLLRDTNRALLLGAAETTDQLEFLIEAGRRLGKVNGVDAADGFNRLALGIGRQSRLLLDDLGLIVKVEDATKRYADSIGTTTDQLGENERKLAFQKAAYDAIRVELERLGDEQLLATDQLSRLRASALNLATDLGKGLIPEVTELAGRWADFVESIDPADVEQAIGDVGAAVSRGVGGIADVILGEGSAARRSVDDLGGALFEAFTNPSAAAFQVVGERLKQIRDVGISYFQELWERFKALAERAGDAVIGGPFGLITEAITGRNLQAEFVKGAAGIGADAVGQQLGFAGSVVGNPETAAQREQREIGERFSSERDRRIEEANKRIALILDNAAGNIKRSSDDQARTAAATAKAAEDLEKGAAGAGGRTPTQAAADAEREAREAAAAKKKAEKEAEKAERDRQKKIQDARREQIRSLNDSIRTLEQETRARDREIAQLERADRNLSAALSGEEAPAESRAEELNRAADKIREFADEVSDINETIKDIDQELVDSRNQLSADLDRAAQQFQDDIQRRARSFLLGGEVEGETTRVRSLRRRAQRERRRRNRDIFQRELGSPSFEDPFGGGSPGGFGIQGVERQGGILDNVPAGLERALAQIIDDTGSTALLDLQAQVTEIVEEAAARSAELNDLRAEALAERARVQKEELDTFIRALDLQRESNAITKELATKVEESKRQLSKLETELDDLRRQVRKGV